MEEIFVVVDGQGGYWDRQKRCWVDDINEATVFLCHELAEVAAVAIGGSVIKF